MVTLENTGAIGDSSDTNFLESGLQGFLWDEMPDSTEPPLDLVTFPDFPIRRRCRLLVSGVCEK